MMACWQRNRLERPDFEEIQRQFARYHYLEQICTPAAASNELFDSTIRFHPSKHGSIHAHPQEVVTAAR